MSETAHLGPDLRERRRASRRGEVSVLPVSAARRPRPMRVVVIGEFNSGKTALINALAGAPVLPASITGHTAYPTVLRFARRPSLAAEIAERRRVPVEWDEVEGDPAPHIRRLHVGMPLERLKALRVIDTPGLDLSDETLKARTIAACRRADVVIWCTPAMQAWKASEQQSWLAMPRSVRKRGILAVTFMDLLRSANDAAKLMARLDADAGDLFRRIVPGSEAVSDPPGLTP
jgi:hypothetical protein